MDRFKYRAWYTPKYSCEDDEKPHYVYDVEQIYDGFTDKGHSELGWVSSFGSLLDDDEYVIEQCTGLKDKNGKLIYEGDIVREISKKEPEWEEYITAVEWGGCGFNLYRDDEFDFLVIGNIHENADLLGEE